MLPVVLVDIRRGLGELDMVVLDMLADYRLEPHVSRGMDQGLVCVCVCGWGGGGLSQPVQHTAEGSPGVAPTGGAD